jgi:AcrR family transcriptional regulator
MSRKSDPERTQAARDRITAAASQLIALKGVDETSLAEIASELGISRGTLFYYYPSKSQLIFDVTDRHFSQVTLALVQRILADKDRLSPPKLLEIVFETILNDQYRGKLHHYLIQEAITSEPSLKEQFRQKYSEWRGLIELTLIEVLDHTLDARHVSFIVLATLDGLLLQTLLGVDEIPLPEITTLLLSQKAQP